MKSTNVSSVINLHMIEIVSRSKKKHLAAKIYKISFNRIHIKSLKKALTLNPLGDLF